MNVCIFSYEFQEEFERVKALSNDTQMSYTKEMQVTGLQIFIIMRGTLPSI